MACLDHVIPLSTKDILQISNSYFTEICQSLRGKLGCELIGIVSAPFKTSSVHSYQLQNFELAYAPKSNSINCVV